MIEKISPQLFVISGPNGAGKSTFTPTLVPEGTLIIDPDIIAGKYKDSMRADFFIGAEKTRAMETRIDVAIETNFLFPDEIKDYLPFKDNGYQINLIYIALEDLKESERRVNTRYSQGGHHVGDWNRELSFTVGKQNTIDSAPYFDTVTVISNSYKHQDSLLATSGKEVLLKNDYAPMWAKELINKFEDSIKLGIQPDRGLKR